MRFDPHSPEVYEPLFRWSGAYFGIKNSNLDEFEALANRKPFRARAQRNAVFVPDAWVTLQPEYDIGPLVGHKMVHEAALARLDGVRVLKGPRFWGLVEAPCFLLRVEVHRMRDQPLPSSLVRKYGNKDEAGAHWEHDGQVRSIYDTLPPQFCSVVFVDGQLLYSLPDLHEIQPPSLRTSCLLGLLRALRSAQFGPAWRRPAIPEGHAIAFAEGAAWPARADMWCPLDENAMTVETAVGDGKPEDLAMGGEMVNKTVISKTHARGPELPGMRWLRTVPPQNVKEVADFNAFLVRFPHRLYSAEVRRVQRVLQVLERLETLSESVLERHEMNTVLTGHSSKMYICADPVRSCFVPAPHLWQGGV